MSLQRSLMKFWNNPSTSTESDCQTVVVVVIVVCFWPYWWQRRHVTFQPVQNKCLVLRPMQMKGTGWRWWNCSGMSCHSLISQYHQAFLSTPKCQGDERKCIQTNDKEMNAHSSNGTCGQGNIPYILPGQKSCSLNIWENNGQRVDT